MKAKQIFLLMSSTIMLLSSCGGDESVYNLKNYGLKPNTKENCSAMMAQAIEKIKSEHVGDDTIRIVLPKGRYDFYPEGAAQKEYYISNHDQDNPKLVGLPFEGMSKVVFDAKGSDFVFHGRMLPVSLVNTSDVTLKNFSVDFENPHISQVKVLDNDTINGIITYEVAPWVNYEVRDSNFVAKGEGWEHTSGWGIAFEGDTKRLVYRTSDIGVGTKQVKEVGERTISAPWNNKKLVPGTIVALRGWGRPTPGVFLSYGKNTRLENIKIHYAEGMGLLAQMSENISLDGFSVCLKGDDDPRAFTTQADATHFSGCKGAIISVNGLYEGMMDDAINVHGTYLRVIKRVDDKTLIGQYMHPQAYGFDWGYVGDTVNILNSKVMEIVQEGNAIAAIKAVDKPTSHGAKQFEITFTNPLNDEISEQGLFGIENMTWTPKVYFANNVIRNNRARGTLFSTPKQTIVENNKFDHTSGTAILLCGDCNGWFETGACHNVVIRNNEFINSLTNMFQFTNAVISIYPEIPELENQKKYFHSNIVIENNIFDTFDQPILYAKSVDGLVFKDNVIKTNTDYPAFHWNNHRFYFQKVTNYVIEGNKIEGGYDESKDLKVE